MAWQIKKYKDGRFRIWSTEANKYITPALPRSTVVLMIEKAWQRNLDEKIETLRADFPIGWIDKDTGRLL